VEADRVIKLQRIEAVRLALTAEQVTDYQLPMAPPKRSDSPARTAGLSHAGSHDRQEDQR
jgi:hypothetical protein